MLIIPHGTPEWRAARLGKFTASRAADATARIKDGWGASRANYAAELVVERMTGAPAEHYISPAMQWGIDHEQEARAAYEFHRNVDVVVGGFVPHPSVSMAGASPDGFVGDEGTVEFKCPLTAQHIDSLLGAEVPLKYRKQMIWQLACTKRRWCDWVSYDPRMPPELRLYVWRFYVSEPQVDELQAQAIAFLREVADRVERLTKLAVRRAA